MAALVTGFSPIRRYVPVNFLTLLPYAGEGRFPFLPVVKYCPPIGGTCRGVIDHPERAFVSKLLDDEVAVIFKCGGPEIERPTVPLKFNVFCAGPHNGEMLLALF